MKHLVTLLAFLLFSPESILAESETSGTGAAVSSADTNETKNVSATGYKTIVICKIGNTVSFEAKDVKLYSVTDTGVEFVDKATDKWVRYGVKAGEQCKAYDISNNPSTHKAVKRSKKSTIEVAPETSESSQTTQEVAPPDGGDAADDNKATADGVIVTVAHVDFSLCHFASAYCPSAPKAAPQNRDSNPQGQDC